MKLNAIQKIYRELESRSVGKIEVKFRVGTHVSRNQCASVLVMAVTDTVIRKTSFVILASQVADTASSWAIRATLKHCLMFGKDGSYANLGIPQRSDFIHDFGVAHFKSSELEKKLELYSDRKRTDDLNIKMQLCSPLDDEICESWASEVDGMLLISKLDVENTRKLIDDDEPLFNIDWLNDNQEDRLIRKALREIGRLDEKFTPKFLYAGAGAIVAAIAGLETQADGEAYTTGLRSIANIQNKLSQQ